MFTDAAAEETEGVLRGIVFGLIQRYVEEVFCYLEFAYG